jgi:A/G-specific adenine glycosylase
MRPTTLAAVAIRWYDGAARDLPWRRPGTSAWGVLVSEVMLQQTPVARVVPAWEAWLRRWPTPAALAASPPGEAIRAWDRLGYPRRALRLHACAVELVARHHGAVPVGLADLLALPGVGAYTARAVAAFAYQQRHPVVDTNVRRVVARVVHGRADGGPTTGAADLAVVESLLPSQPARAARAGVALMELGALVCTARGPACGSCPLRRMCAWRLAGRPANPSETARRPQRYAGTDRQVRGLLLAVARGADGPVGRTELDAVWPDAAQRDRALAGLLADGLLTPIGEAGYALPG